MKKVIKNSLLMLALFTTMYAYSGEVITFSNHSIKGSVLVKIDQVEKGTQLLIKDLEGVSLYNENIIEDGAFNKTFDLSTLPDAEYYFEISTEDVIKTIPFSISNSDVAFNQGAEKSIYKPKILIEDNFVYVSNTSSVGQDMGVEVFYEGYDLAFDESFSGAESINRTYDFSNSLKGTYTIVLKTEGRTFVDYIDIP